MIDEKGRFKKGIIPHNKGKGKHRKFLDGFPVECKHHGLHSDWRVHTENNLQCQICSRERTKRYNSRLDIRPRRLWLYARKHAFNRREFSLEIKDIEELFIKQNNRCALSGIEFNENNISSLDRIDSNKGYTKNNVQLVLKEINVMKSNFELNKFLNLCRIISNFQEEVQVSGDHTLQKD